MQDFIAYPSRSRLALMAFGSAVFVVLGLWMGGLFGPPPASHRYPPSLVFGAGWLAVFFFALCGVVAIKRMFDSGEQLRIGTAGIRFKPWSDQTIPWSEIADVTTWTMGRQSSITLHLRNPDRYPGHGILGLLANANRKMTGGDVSISLAGTDRKFDEALAAIQRFRR